jgi:pyrroloquinoline quinone (PQQ) biosynthesis protein C
MTMPRLAGNPDLYNGMGVWIDTARALGVNRDRVGASQMGLMWKRYRAL